MPASPELRDDNLLPEAEHRDKLLATHIDSPGGPRVGVNKDRRGTPLTEPSSRQPSIPQAATTQDASVWTGCFLSCLK